MSASNSQIDGISWIFDGVRLVKVVENAVVGYRKERKWFGDLSWGVGG